MDFQSKIESMLASATLDPQKLPGTILFAADKTGRTLFHGAAGIRQLGKNEPMNKDDMGWIASCTKLVTAIACLQLVERGQFPSLDAPVVDVLPELGHKSYLAADGTTKSHDVPITLRHLLTHTSGHSYEFFNQATFEYQEKTGWKSFDCSRASVNAPLNAVPGTRWEYGTGLDWAGFLVERLTKLTLEQYFRQHIFDPLELKDITCNPVSRGFASRLFGRHLRLPDGKLEPSDLGLELDESKREILYGGAALFANVAEYGQILVALLNGGTHPKTKGKILEPASVDEMFKDALSAELVKDLYKPFADPHPELFVIPTVAPDYPRQWCIAGEKAPEGLPTGRSGDSVWWAGICNCYWWCDRGNGDCGMIQTQILPFFDPNVIDLFFVKFETAVHAETKAALARSTA